MNITHNIKRNPLTKKEFIETYNKFKDKYEYSDIYEFGRDWYGLTKPYVANLYTDGKLDR